MLLTPKTNVHGHQPVNLLIIRPFNKSPPRTKRSTSNNNQLQIEATYIIGFVHAWNLEKRKGCARCIINGRNAFSSESGRGRRWLCTHAPRLVLGVCLHWVRQEFPQRGLQRRCIRQNATEFNAPRGKALRKYSRRLSSICRRKCAGEEYPSKRKWTFPVV